MKTYRSIGVVLGLFIAASAWATDSPDWEGPATLDLATHQLFDSQDPPHTLVFPNATKTLTGHGTVTINTTEMGAVPNTAKLVCTGNIVCSQRTGTGTSTATGTVTALDITANGTANGTSVATGHVVVGAGLQATKQTGTGTSTATATVTAFDTSDTVTVVNTSTNTSTVTATNWSIVKVGAGSNITAAQDATPVNIGAVAGTGTMTGTTNYLPVKTPTGWGDSTFYEDSADSVTGHSGGADYRLKLRGFAAEGSYVYTGISFGTLDSAWNAYGPIDIEYRVGASWMSGGTSRLNFKFNGTTISVMTAGGLAMAGSATVSGANLTAAGHAIQDLEATTPIAAAGGDYAFAYRTGTDTSTDTSTGTATSCPLNRACTMVRTSTTTATATVTNSVNGIAISSNPVLRPSDVSAVATNTAITASGATNKIVQYDTKGLVVAGFDATAANVGADVSGAAAARAAPGTCSGGQYVSATTTSGVTCSTPSGTGMTCYGTCSGGTVAKFASSSMITNAVAGTDYATPANVTTAVNAAVNGSTTYVAGFASAHVLESAPISYSGSSAFVTGTAYAGGYALCQSNGSNCPSASTIGGLPSSTDHIANIDSHYATSNYGPSPGACSVVTTNSITTTSTANYLAITASMTAASTVVSAIGRCLIQVDIDGTVPPWGTGAYSTDPWTGSYSYPSSATLNGFYVPGNGGHTISLSICTPSGLSGQCIIQPGSLAGHSASMTTMLWGH